MVKLITKKVKITQFLKLCNKICKRFLITKLAKVVQKLPKIFSQSGRNLEVVNCPESQTYFKEELVLIRIRKEEWQNVLSCRVYHFYLNINKPSQSIKRCKTTDYIRLLSVLLCKLHQRRFSIIIHVNSFKNMRRKNRGIFIVRR